MRKRPSKFSSKEIGQATKRLGYKLGWPQQELMKANRINGKFCSSKAKFAGSASFTNR